MGNVLAAEFFAPRKSKRRETPAQIEWLGVRHLTCLLFAFFLLYEYRRRYSPRKQIPIN